MATVHQRQGQTDGRLTVAIPRNTHSASRGKNDCFLDEQELNNNENVYFRTE